MFIFDISYLKGVNGRLIVIVICINFRLVIVLPIHMINISRSNRVCIYFTFFTKWDIYIFRII